MDSLQSMAINRRITILIADHTRKTSMGFADPIDDVMGSTSKSRALDAVLAIYKEQGKAGAILKGRGRETEEIDLALEFDQITGCWQSKGNTTLLQLTEARNEIIDFLALAGKSQLTTIAAGVGKDKGNTSRRLADLVSQGLINKETIEGKVYFENA